LRWLKRAGIVHCVGIVRRGRRLLPLGLVGVVASIAGCGWSGRQTSLVPVSDFAREILHVYGIITWAVLVIAAVVIGVLGWVLIRFRDRPGAALPRQTRGHALLEIGWTIAPAFVLLIIAVPTIHVVFRTQGAPPSGALEVVVRGRQWWWEFAYPTYQVTTANELHLPLGRPVVLRLEGPDVIHSFWVPQLGGKRDVVPGRRNQIAFTPDTPGTYFGQCAEFCGTSHANMLLRLVVEPAETFERWVAAERAPAAQPQAGPAADGAAVFAASACVGCHTVRGVSSGVIGPDLTHFGGRATLAAGLLPNTVDNVTAWILDPPRIKPGVKMPALGLTEAQARAIAVYLSSLK
jgi:cytochrome c oxidase subunit 2